MPRRKIRWTGPGSDPGGLHTKKRFLELVHNKYREHIYWRMRGDTYVPPEQIRKNDIDGWMQLVDATWFNAE